MDFSAKHNRLILLPAVAATLVGAALAVIARGFAGEEEIAHYLIARYAPVQPELFLSLVGRPLVTVALTLPSQGPLWLARLASAAATGSAVLALGLVAHRTRWVSPWLMAALFMLQPFLLAHAGTAMTEPWAAALAAWGLAGLVLRRPLWLVLAAALLPLARLETVVFWPFVLWIALRDGGWRWLPLLPVPIFLWNLGGFISSGDPLWLLHQSNWKPYPARDALHYLKSLAWITGLGVFVPAVVGQLAGHLTYRGHAAEGGQALVVAARQRAWWGATTVLAMFLVAYTVLAVWHPITFGNLRYFAYAAPALALLAAAGLSVLRSRPVRTGWIAVGLTVVGAYFLWGHPLYRDFAVLKKMTWWPLGVALVWAALYALPAWSRRLAPALVLALGLLSLVKDNQSTLHWQLDPEQDGVARAARMLHDPLPERVQIYSSHPLMAYYRGQNPYDGDSYPQVGGTFAKTARPGTLLFWDTHYVLQRSPNLGVQEFMEDETWTFLGGVTASDTSWAGGYFFKNDGRGVTGILARGGMPSSQWLSIAAMAQTSIPLTRRAAHADPGHGGRWLTLALSYAAAGADQQSWEALTRAEAIDPDNYEIRAFKADVYRREKQFDQALSEAQRALALQPDDPAMHYLVGRVYLSMNKPEEARPYLTRAGLELKNRWDIQYVVGGFLYNHQEFAAAVPHLRQALRLEPRHSQTVMLAAGALWRLGRIDETIEVLETFLERDPGFTRAYAILGDVYRRENRMEEAREVYRRGLEHTGDPQFKALLESGAPPEQK